MKTPVRIFKCLDCGKEFEAPFGKPRWMLSCPSCGSENIVRIGTKTAEGKEERFEDVPPGWWGRRGAGAGWGFRFRGGWRGGFGRGRGRGWGRGPGWCRW
ncbi:hypothetical protein [Desulfurobacterium sp.]